jgi:L-lactate utilization protein LutB
MVVLWIGTLFLVKKKITEEKRANRQKYSIIWEAEQMETVFENHWEKLGKYAVEALNKNGFKAQYAPNKTAALTAVLELIDKSATVGMGGSHTMDDLGVLNALQQRGNMVFNHQGLSKEEAFKVRRQEITADVFLSGANAVTLEGELVNVDGSGNRVAALAFGPRKVIVVAGANKVVKDEAAARERIKMLAAPLNADRLQRKTPCRATGMCMDCHSPERICNVTTITHRPLTYAEIHVVIVGESLGY